MSRALSEPGNRLSYPLASSPTSAFPHAGPAVRAAERDFDSLSPLKRSCHATYGIIWKFGVAAPCLRTVTHRAELGTTVDYSHPLYLLRTLEFLTKKKSPPVRAPS